MNLDHLFEGPRKHVYRQVIQTLRDVTFLRKSHGHNIMQVTGHTNVLAIRECDWEEHIMPRLRQAGTPFAEALADGAGESSLMDGLMASRTTKFRLIYTTVFCPKLHEKICLPENRAPIRLHARWRAARPEFRKIPECAEV